MFFPAETQSRRDKRRENQEEAEGTEPGANAAGGIRLCLFHPSAGRTSSSSLSAPFVLPGPCFSAGNSPPLLAPIVPNPKISLDATHISPSLAEKVSVRQDAGPKFERISK